MKRVVYFLSCVVLMVVLAVSCKHKNPADDPQTPTDSIPSDTMSRDTIPVDTTHHDTIPVDTIGVDTIPADTIPADTTIVPIDTLQADSDGYIHRLFLQRYVGEVVVPKSTDDYVCEDVSVDLLKSDTIQGKYKMYLNQVSFDAQMPRMDIVLDGISADEDGKLWCDSLIPIGVNFFNTGFDLPVPAYEVYHMEGETYYDTKTGAAYYSTSLEIKGIGTAKYLGSREMEL